MTTGSIPTLRWGILGCARISRRGLIPGIRASAQGTLLGLASRDRALAQAWCDEFGIPKAYGGYDALVADPEIDAIYIPLPNELHKPWVCAAADAGKHILCEKPLSLDAAEAAAMVEYCQARRVVLMEAFMWRHQPRTQALQRMVAEGAIGTLRLIRSSFSFPIESDDWRLDSSRGGGALWDVGCYGVSTARLFAQAEPETIHTVAHFGPTGVDMSLAAVLRFPGDILAAIDCSFEQPFRCSYELVGTTGAIEVPLAYLPPDPAPARLLDPDGAVLQELTFDGRDQYACMVDIFARSVAAGHLLAPAETGQSQMEALDAILAAAR